jgi:hypothetical protein
LVRVAAGNDLPRRRKTRKEHQLERQRQTAQSSQPELTNLVGTWRGSFIWSETQISFYPDGRVIVLTSSQKNVRDEWAYQDGIVVSLDESEDETLRLVLVEEDVLLGYDAEDDEGGAALEFHRVDRVPREKWVEG